MKRKSQKKFISEEGGDIERQRETEE